MVLHVFVFKKFFRACVGHQNGRPTDTGDVQEMSDTKMSDGQAINHCNKKKSVECTVFIARKNNH